jgi:hypothetical protein
VDHGICMVVSYLTNLINNQADCPQRQIRGEEFAEKRILFERCIIEYIQRGIWRASFKFCMGDKLRNTNNNKLQTTAGHSLLG